MSNQKLSSEQFEQLAKHYLEHPEDFVKEVLDADMWDLQEQILRAVFEYAIVAVKSCNAAGKTYLAAKVATTFLHIIEHSIVVTTAPTWRQVTDILWRDIATTVKRAKYKLSDAEVTQAGLTLDTDWYAVGLSTKYPENFFGYHADHILVIVDEAGGVPEPIFRGVKAITPNANAHVLYIGNPTTAGGTFFDQFDLTKNLPVKRFTISAFDTPNFIDTGIRNLEDLLAIFTPPDGVDAADHVAGVTARLKEKLNPQYAALIDPAVVYQRFLEWGVDSPAWQALVMGEFPSQSDQSLVPINLIDQAMNNYGVDKETGRSFADLSGWQIPEGEYEYGVDMARFGSDSTVFTPRHGGFVEQQVIWGKVDLIESADRIIKLIDPYKERGIKIDDTGNGGGTTDALTRYRALRQQDGKAPYNYRISAYQMASGPRDKNKFADITSEMYWNLREWFMNKQIALPFDSQLRSELIARRWSITPAGKIKVESKDEYRKRTGGKSPDRADSLALAFAYSLSEREELQLNEDTPNLEPQHIRPLTQGLGKW